MADNITELHPAPKPMNPAEMLGARLAERVLAGVTRDVCEAARLPKDQAEAIVKAMVYSYLCHLRDAIRDFAEKVYHDRLDGEDIEHTTPRWYIERVIAPVATPERPE